MPKPLIDVPRYAPIQRSSYIVMEDGRIRVDPAKKDIAPFWLTTEPEEITIPGAVNMCSGVLAGGIADVPAVLPIDQKGPFEICYSMFAARYAAGPLEGEPTDQFTVAIFDPEFRPLLMNREIHARTIGGGFGSVPTGSGYATAFATAGGRPLVWPETFFMEPAEGGKALFMGFRNLTNYPIKIRWVFAGIRYYHWAAFEKAVKEKAAMCGRGRVSFPYFYTTDTDVRLVGGAAREYDIRLTDEADVEIFKMTHYSDYPFLWRLQEKAGKRHLDSAGALAAGLPNGIHSDFGWGDGEFPFIPFETAYYEQNTKVMLVLVNGLTQNTNRIFPTLVCRKITYAR